ncbi:MAG: hypothetical protein CMA63_03150 [Euryarchaeota archaeon]|nr:hypothetical protein [Euryarchaeota archaeon]
MKGGERMKDLGNPNIDLSRFLNTSGTHNIGGKRVDATAMMNNISMVSMRINADNVEHVKYLTTEGLTKDQRLAYVRNLSNEFGVDVFEFSTCNRVLYVGFSSDIERLKQAVLSSTSLEDAPFDSFTGIDVWRHLVKVCSGLDSFIMGELQVMSQFRGAVSWHRKNGLLSDINSSFFEHVVSGNRIIRKHFDFNQTTESMLNLATTAMVEALEENQNSSIVILGYGEMGRKASQVLVSLGQTNHTIVSRNPEKSRNRKLEGSESVQFISFDEWHGSTFEVNMVISTVRNTTPMYDADTQLPVISKARVMDFSWPPSIDTSALHEGQVLYGMEHWIRAAHRLGIEWDYQTIIDQSEQLIHDIEKKYMGALTDKSNAQFRSHMYTAMEKLSQSWVEEQSSDDSHAAQYGPFSREIATWICNQEGPFSIDQLQEMVLSTDRPFDTILLKRVASDVTESILLMNQRATLSEAKP